jgi:hypothetical protein
MISLLEDARNLILLQRELVRLGIRRYGKMRCLRNYDIPGSNDSLHVTDK